MKRRCCAEGGLVTGLSMVAMRVLFLTKRFYTNKDLIADRYGRLFHLPVEMARLGHTVSVLALDYRGIDTADLSVGDATFQTLPARGTRLVGLWGQLQSEADRFEPDVVVGSADTPLGWLAQRLARRNRARFVFDVYNNYQSFASARLPAMKRVFAALLRDADLVVAASGPLVTLARQRGANVVQIVNGVDPQVFKALDKRLARDTLGLPITAIVVGYFGSVEPERGIETMVEAIARLRDEGMDITLLVAGADKLGLETGPAWMDYRGTVDQSDVPRLVNACDVVVLPYLANAWGDFTYPNKLAEYLACEVPIVATEVSGFVDVLGAGAPGLCAPGDPVAMADAIRDQIRNPVTLPANRAATWGDLAVALTAAISAG